MPQKIDTTTDATLKYLKDAKANGTITDDVLGYIVAHIVSDLEILSSHVDPGYFRSFLQDPVRDWEAIKNLPAKSRRRRVRQAAADVTQGRVNTESDGVISRRVGNRGTLDARRISNLTRSSLATRNRLVAVVDAGDIWTSTNAGLTWTDQTSSGPASNQVWLSIASDSTGTNLVAVDALVTGNNGNIWTSTDSGVTWTDQTKGNAALSQTWLAVASSSTGSHIVAVGRGIVWTN